MHRYTSITFSLFMAIIYGLSACNSTHRDKATEALNKNVDSLARLCPMTEKDLQQSTDSVILLQTDSGEVVRVRINMKFSGADSLLEAEFKNQAFSYLNTLYAITDTAYQGNAKWFNDLMKRTVAANAGMQLVYSTPKGLVREHHFTAKHLIQAAHLNPLDRARALLRNQLVLMNSYLPLKGKSSPDLIRVELKDNNVVYTYSYDPGVHALQPSQITSSGLKANLEASLHSGQYLLNIMQLSEAQVGFVNIYINAKTGEHTTISVSPQEIDQLIVQAGQ